MKIVLISLLYFLAFTSISPSIFADSALFLVVKSSTHQFEVTKTFSHDNDFTILISEENLQTANMHYQVSSPGLPSGIFEYSFDPQIRAQVVTLKYPDPYFTSINYQKLSLGELVLLIENETDFDLLTSIFTALAQAARFDLLDGLSDYVGRGGISESSIDHFLMFICLLEQQFRSTGEIVKKLKKLKAKVDTKIQKSKVTIVLSLFTGISLNDINGLTLKIKSSDSLSTFIQFLATNLGDQSPAVLNYLLQAI
ncbi:MAG: hypothetical protein ISR65_08855 [Bacteriovoracaceae bacterium]|nr:hypothetical protein [Bacteriovoracaceae bacterium]